MLTYVESAWLSLNEAIKYRDLHWNYSDRAKQERDISKRYEYQKKRDLYEDLFFEAKGQAITALNLAFRSGELTEHEKNERMDFVKREMVFRNRKTSFVNPFAFRMLETFFAPEGQIGFSAVFENNN